jgi:hypothetical protein
MKGDLTLAELIAWMDPFAEYRPIRLGAIMSEIEAYESDREYIAALLSTEDA